MDVSTESGRIHPLGAHTSLSVCMKCCSPHSVCCLCSCLLEQASISGSMEKSHLLKQRWDTALRNVEFLQKQMWPSQSGHLHSVQSGGAGSNNAQH